MGTRHITEVKLGGELKVSQYGQWDGYPTGQGQEIADFLKKVDLPKFKEQIKALEYPTSEEIQKMCDEVGEEWKEVYPGFSRDAGAGILQLIHDGITTKVYLDKEFKNDGLMCEYVYTIDLDKETVTVGDLTFSFKQWKRKGLMEKLENQENQD